MQYLPKRIGLLQSIINDLYKADNDYVNNLVNIKGSISIMLNSYINQNNKKPISSYLMILSKYIEEKCSIMKGSIELIQKEILTPIENYLNDSKKSRLFDEIKQQEKEISQLFITMNKVKAKYYESMQKAEKAIYDCQMGIKTKIPIDKFKSKATDRINEGKVAEKDYKESLNIINKKCLDYYENLNSHQKLEENFYAFENSVIVKLNAILMDRYLNYLQNLKKDSEMLKKVFEHRENQKNNEIKTNNENELVQYPFEEYIPSAFTSNFYPNEINFSVLMTLQKHFALDIDKKINCEETKKEIMFKNITEHIMQHCQSVSKKEIEELKKIIVEKDYRTQFITFLNQERSKCTQFDSDNGYKNISDILDFMLNQISVDDLDEFENAKTILLLSQSFFKLVEKKKIYVEESLKNNVLFGNEKFWKIFMERAIENDIQKTSSSNFGQIPYLAIMTNINNFVEFVKEENKILMIIEHLEQKFNLSKENKEKVIAEMHKEIEQKQGKNQE